MCPSCSIRSFPPLIRYCRVFCDSFALIDAPTPSDPNGDNVQQLAAALAYQLVDSIHDTTPTHTEPGGIDDGVEPTPQKETPSDILSSPAQLPPSDRLPEAEDVPNITGTTHCLYLSNQTTKQCLYVQIHRITFPLAFVVYLAFSLNRRTHHYQPACSLILHHSSHSTTLLIPPPTPHSSLTSLHLHSTSPSSHTPHTSLLRILSLRKEKRENEF